MGSYCISTFDKINFTKKSSNFHTVVPPLSSYFQAKEETVHYPIQNTTYGNILHTSTVGLRFRAEKHHFEPDGDMKLKCTASIGDIYWQTNEKSAEGYKSKRASMSSSSMYDSYVHDGGNQSPAGNEKNDTVWKMRHFTLIFLTLFFTKMAILLFFLSNEQTFLF